MIKRTEVTEVGKKKLGEMRKWGGTKTLKSGSETITRIVKGKGRVLSWKKIRLYLKSVWIITCQVLNISESDFQKVEIEEREQSVAWPSSPRPTEVISRDDLDHELGAFELIRGKFWLAQMRISRTACWASSTIMPSRTLPPLTNQLKEAFNHYKIHKAFPCLRKSTLNLPGFLAPPYLFIFPS